MYADAVLNVHLGVFAWAVPRTALVRFRTG
jgi:hypothetical protein